MPTLGDPTAFSLGPVEVRWYALFILAGILGAIALSSWLAGQRGREADFLLDIAPWVVFLSIAGARLYYVLLEWEYFIVHPGQALNIRSGGLSIHGALIVGVITVIVLCRRHGQPFFAWADIIMPGVALGQAVGRWGNWANQEAFGTPTDLPWAVTIDPARRPEGYEQVATFHPTFLYESIFNLLNAVLLSWLVLRLPGLRNLRNGDVAALYLVNYGIIRLVIERIRTDSLYIGPLPAAYWLSFLLIGCGVAIMVIVRNIGQERVAADPQPGAAGRAIGDRPGDR
jgi:phosphatidylglycerol:prolipoprotein diacylglycerol transferase